MQQSNDSGPAYKKVDDEREAEEEDLSTKPANENRPLLIVTTASAPPSPITPHRTVEPQDDKVGPMFERIKPFFEFLAENNVLWSEYGQKLRIRQVFCSEQTKFARTHKVMCSDHPEHEPTIWSEEPRP